MSLTGMNCQVRLTCANMTIWQCSAAMKDCDTNFDPKVQIEHNQQSARFTCTNNDCSTLSPATCAPETTTTTTTTTATTTVTTSVPYCETTHITTPSPVIGEISPAMCTPATITTTVVASTPQCETTHTTHSCKTTSIVCNSSSTNLLATNINPLYTTSSIPIPTSTNMYTSLTGQNTTKNIISSHVADSAHPTMFPSNSRCVCSYDISPCTGQSRSATTLHGVYMTVLLVLVAVTITMTTLVVYMCLMMRRAKSGRVPQTTTGTTHTNNMAASEHQPIAIQKYMQSNKTGKGKYLIVCTCVSETLLLPCTQKHWSIHIVL